MANPDILEKKEHPESNHLMKDFQKEQKDLIVSIEKSQVEAIINGLFMFINPLDTKKVDDLVDYICSGDLGSHKNEDLEKMTTYIIYGSYEINYLNPTPLNLGRDAFTRKLKYIQDNYGKDLKIILTEINKKEKEILSKTNTTPQKEEKGILEGAIDRLKDAYNYGTDKLSALWNIATNLVPNPVKDWVKNNLFSPEKQQNTENINEIYKKLEGREKPDFLPFYLAMQGYNKQKNNLGNKKYLTVVDYSKPVSQNRLYVINMDTLKVENCVPTGHGKNSGNTQKTSRFSNIDGSNQTSIGFFKTPSDLQPNSKGSRKGLFLTGMEYSNNKAKARGIAVHPVRSFFYGRTENGHRAGDSTSEGCITIRSKDNPGEIMDKIKGDSLIYSYYPDMTYLNKSAMIK